MRQELIRILCEKSVNFADSDIYKLASGAKSNFYVYCKTTVMNGRGGFLVGNLILDAICRLEFVAVGGLEKGAIPIAEAVSVLAQVRGRNINAFWVNKTQKDHGVIRWVDGDIQKGDRVVIVEDVATTGGSTIKAIERARSEGLEVVAVVVLVDRQEGGIQNIQKYAPNTRALITREELEVEWQQGNYAQAS